jgi:hypothetical protein
VMAKMHASSLPDLVRMADRLGLVSDISVPVPDASDNPRA